MILLLRVWLVIFILPLASQAGPENFPDREAYSVSEKPAHPPRCNFEPSKNSLSRSNLSSMGHLKTHCLDNPGALADLGFLLAQQGYWLEAADLLELALMQGRPVSQGQFNVAENNETPSSPNLDAMLQPDQEHRVRLVYGDVLAGLGDRESARGVWQALYQEQIPSLLRQEIAERLRVLEAFSQSHEAGTLTVNNVVTVRQGYDQNLNGATRATEVNLSFPVGNVLLGLHPLSRARRGQFTHIEWLFGQQYNFSSSHQLLFQGSLRTRHAPQENDTDFGQGEWHAISRWASGDIQHEFRLGGGRIYYDRQFLFQSRRFGYGIGLKTANSECVKRIGVDLEYREYAIQSELDHRVSSFQSEYTCDGPSPWGWQVGLGKEQSTIANARQDRPGGSTLRLDFRTYRRDWLTYFGIQSDGWIDSELILGRSQDESGYSPLLERGARRVLNRINARADLVFPLNPSWQLLLSGEYSRQQSNLALFDTRNFVVSAGMRYSF